MKKRILALLLAATFALAGCGSNKPNSELDKFTSEITAEPENNVENAADNVADNATSDAAESTDTPEEDKYYLTFEANTIDGGAWNSENFANSKVTMINIWGTYCNPCLAEMPDLGEIAGEYDAADFQLIGVICDVMEDADEETIETAKELIEETQANYPHLLLNESLYVNLVGAVSAVPTTFFVRQDGSLMGYLTGAQSKDAWKELIDRLLAEEQ